MREKIRKISQKALEHRFIKFLVTGGTGFLFDLIMLIIISFLFFQGTNYSIFGIMSLPKFISSLFGLSLVFYLNRNWVFNAKNKNLNGQLGRFIIVSVINVFFVSIIFNLYYQLYLPSFSALPLSQNMIKLIINGFTSLSSEGTKMLLSFFLYKYIVFRVNSKE